MTAISHLRLSISRSREDIDNRASELTVSQIQTLNNKS